MGTATYTNNDESVRFPFRDDQNLPIPNSVITAISVHILVNHVDTAPPDMRCVVDSINIGEHRVYVDLSLLHAGEALPLGHITADKYDRGSTFTPAYAADDNLAVEAFAIMQLGEYQASEVGVYEGPYELDPHCVLITQAAGIRGTNAVAINGRTISVSRVLAFMQNATAVVKLNKSSSSQSTMTIAHAGSSENTDIAYKDATLGVYSVNGIDVTTDSSAGTTLSMSTSDAEVLELELSGGNAAVITLDGTYRFKHCFGEYDHDEDHKESR